MPRFDPRPRPLQSLVLRQVCSHRLPDAGTEPLSNAHSRHSRKWRQQGVAAVEFALVLPLLLGVLLAVIELGLMLYNQAVLTQASREGARAGIVLRDPKPSDTEIRQVVLRHTDGVLLNLRGTASPQVTVVQSNPAAFPNPLQVTVRYSFSGLTVAPLLGALQQPVVLSATTVMVNE